MAYTIKEPSKAMTFVDLGLSVNWAQVNIGADYFDESGNFYAWGETDNSETAARVKPDATGWNYTYNTTPYQTAILSESDLSSNNTTKCSWYKYSKKSEVLEKEDDAATVAWESGWRMPTETEAKKLREYTDKEYVVVNGVTCMKLTSTKAGYTDKSLFLPAVGYREGTTHRNYKPGNTSICYWTSSLARNGNMNFATYIYAYFYNPDNRSKSFGLPIYGRYWGMQVRAVYDK